MEAVYDLEQFIGSFDDVTFLGSDVTEHIHGPLWLVSRAELNEQSWFAKHSQKSYVGI